MFKWLKRQPIDTPDTSFSSDIKNLRNSESETKPDWVYSEFPSRHEKTKGIPVKCWKRKPHKSRSGNQVTAYVHRHIKESPSPLESYDSGWCVTFFEDEFISCFYRVKLNSHTDGIKLVERHIKLLERCRAGNEDRLIGLPEGFNTSGNIKTEFGSYSIGTNCGNSLHFYPTQQKGVSFAPTAIIETPDCQIGESGFSKNGLIRLAERHYKIMLRRKEKGKIPYVYKDEKKIYIDMTAGHRRMGEL